MRAILARVCYRVRRRCALPHVEDGFPEGLRVGGVARRRDRGRGGETTAAMCCEAGVLEAAAWAAGLRGWAKPLPSGLHATGTAIDVAGA